MKYFHFHPDGDDAGGNMGGESGAPADTPTFDAPDDAEQGGATPEEIAAILHVAPPTPAADPADDKDDEEAIENADPAQPGPANPDQPETDPANPADPTKPVPPAPDKPAGPDNPTDEEAPTFTLDVEDADGKIYTISDIKELPREFEPKDNLQIMEILDQIRDLREQKKVYDTDQAKKTSEAETQASVTKIQDSWNNEIKALTAEKRITATADPDKNPRVQAIYDFMQTENDKRAAAGRPLLATIEDTLNALERKEATDAKEKARVAAKSTARSNGSLVGGSSAPASGSAPSYIPGSAKNANQALRATGLVK